MVVVSANWMKNVATYPNDMVIENKMTARAVFICRPNSHPFQERTLTLDQPVKVGRSVARAKATATNAIFDCKVLSRHHALLWYENGKFYLQDTKSSNGTFVNNHRLAADSEHHEVSSGDIVQFGVDVIENNKKVTHGCIIATLKLYLPDGKEAKASPSIVENNTHVVPLDELYKLHQIIQEASQREQVLETKLAALQAAVDAARTSAEESWQAYVGEERLLSRVSVLETQLQQAAKNWGEDKYREENTRLQEEIDVYQAAAKEALEKLHSERLEALAKVTEQEQCRITTEQEMLLTREQICDLQRELEELAKKVTEEQTKFNEEKVRSSRQQWELQAQLNFEKERNEDLKSALKYMNGSDSSSLCHMDFSSESTNINQNIYETGVKMKSVFSEDNCEENGVDSEHNHISLTVAPVSTTTVEGDEKSQENEEKGTSDTKEDESSKNVKHVTFDLQQQQDNEDTETDDDKSPTRGDGSGDDVGTDTKTLKYKYQAAQIEMKKQIESLQSLLELNQTQITKLEASLEAEKETNQFHEEQKIVLTKQVNELKAKLSESLEENEVLRQKIASLSDENDTKSQKNQTISTNTVNYEQLVSVEEELVFLKERYAKINEEKVKLQHELANAKQRYNQMCNSSYDKMYFYIAPLILIIFYLVISAMIS